MSNAVFTVCVRLLELGGLEKTKRSIKILSDFGGSVVPELYSAPLPENEDDPAGLLYQALRTEGEKIRNGSYYTPRIIVDDMMKRLAPCAGETVFDPCCGSGAFLLSVPNATPERLFGIDADPSAVLIAQTNLLLKFSDRDFTPNIHVADFLTGDLPAGFPDAFDCAAANPPWGGESPANSKRGANETFTVFLRRTFDCLTPDGRLNFLLPESALNVRSHRELRRFLLCRAKLITVSAYPRSFSGVLTACAGILAAKSKPAESFLCVSGAEENLVKTAACLRRADFTIRSLSAADEALLDKIAATPHRTLNGSDWGIGIVTGDNRSRLLDAPAAGAEEIVTGKDIRRYAVLTPRKYVVLDRGRFQQAAPENIYRAEEKLLYKFISSKLVFAYDDRRRLSLNSANILIPHVPGVTVKAVMALLNSSVLNYFHRQKSGGVKILKSDLLRLPIPEIDAETADYLDKTAAALLLNPADQALDTELDRRISGLFNLTGDEHERVVNFQSAR